MTELKEQLHKARTDLRSAEQQTYDLRLKSLEAIAQVKQFYAQAAELKKSRDAENEKVQEFKKKRQEAQTKANEILTQLQTLRSQLDGLPNTDSPGKLKAELERMEWEQMTEAVSAKAEKELSRRINELRSQLGPAEKLTGIFTQIRLLENQLRNATAQVRIFRTELVKHAKASDAHHESMLKLYKKAQSLSKKIGENLKELDEKRALLDEERKEFFKIAGQVKAAEGAERAQYKARQKAEADAIKAEKDAQLKAIQQRAAGIAQNALEKFKKGGKLTWEDLQAIQAAGLESNK